ncbi:hypothetical protein D3C81_305080 [compost metagenome]
MHHGPTVGWTPPVEDFVSNTPFIPQFRFIGPGVFAKVQRYHHDLVVMSVAGTELPTKYSSMFPRGGWDQLCGSLREGFVDIRATLSVNNPIKDPVPQGNRKQWVEFAMWQMNMSRNRYISTGLRDNNV